MQIEKTKLAGCVVVTPKTHTDDRGYFMESYRRSWMDSLTDFSGDFVQDNQSLSHYGTIRGLHFQIGENAQSKLLRVLQGSILDVVVDLRQDSPTYGEHISVELSDENNHQLWVPKGFAHGFSVLSETALLCYKCDAYYNKDGDYGIHPLDETLNIDWKIPKAVQVLSEKDSGLPKFKEIAS
ncbi:MAG: dTDP-4-dehydrorhamnose 3,5-epimerase [Flavobacteriaceae bacterium]|jgi:dTDP-4-dehydrorhamnose 3,5-epimerase|nr:dTDP-4-dehydrorhamnose 3,5-epimerase [Flavobacteriaceae bacterium]|tara:strand:+ start:11715 stop:12260 length:546 start_codon:yes stop_codon:yes gene_type:complete